MYKLFAVTIRNISLQFVYSLLQVYIVHRVSFIFHLNVFLVSVCTRGFGYLLCWPRERGKGLVCTRRFSFHEFYNFLLFNLLIFISFWKTIFLPTPFTHTHTHDPRPLPTTHDPRHLATLIFWLQVYDAAMATWRNDFSSLSYDSEAPIFRCDEIKNLYCIYLQCCQDNLAHFVLTRFRVAPASTPQPRRLIWVQA